MVPKLSVEVIPCPDPQCIDGTILVHNAYSETPLVPEEQPCDRCGGKGYLVYEDVDHLED